MPQQVVADTDLYTIEHDDGLDCYVFTWNDFASGERFRSGADDWYEAYQKNPSPNVIVDASSVEAHDEAEQQWIQEDWVPRMLDAGVERIVTVVADSAIAKMDAEEILDGIKHLDYEPYLTDSVEDGRDWIRRQ